MLYLTRTTITGVDLAHYGVSRVRDWVSGDCGTIVASFVWWAKFPEKKVLVRSSKSCYSLTMVL